MKKLLISLVIIFLIAFTLPAFAIDVTVGWDANDPAPAGYAIYWDTVNEIPFGNTADVPSGTQHTVPDLEEGTTYYFAVDAYDSSGNRSVYSNILEYTVAADRIIIKVIDRPKSIKFIWE